MNDENFNDTLNKYIENFIKTLEDIIKDRDSFKKAFEKFVIIGKDFMEIINKCLNDAYFDDIKSKYKEFSESIASLTSFINAINTKKDKLNKSITEYGNIRDSKIYNEIYNQNNNDEKYNIVGYEEYLKKEDKLLYISNDNILKPQENIKPVEIKIINLDYYYYSISFYSKTEISKDFNFDSLMKELEICYKNKKMCLTKIHKNTYVNDVIRSNKFENDKIMSSYLHQCPKLFEIEEIILIRDFLINKCKIKKSELDYRGNAINFNLSHNNKRGQEKYDPPHGCICLGLNCIGKYENDDWLHNKSESSKWAIAYHGIGNLSDYINIKEMIKSIIKNGVKPGSSQDKKGQKDKRHPQKTIGEGVYLYPSFKNAEENAGIIIINHKKYKIILMARVLIEKISEPEDAEQWILEEDDIRPYRILVKRID